jgi:Tfp pilus assembly protein PilE
MKNSKGITLIEILVIVVIIAIIGLVVSNKIISHSQGTDKTYHINR